MGAIVEMSAAELQQRLERTRGEYEAFRARGLKLDMTRGKPAPDSSTSPPACWRCPATATTSPRRARTRATMAASRAFRRCGPCSRR
jgi:hypothetical protein